MIENNTHQLSDSCFDHHSTGLLQYVLCGAAFRDNPESEVDTNMVWILWAEQLCQYGLHINATALDTSRLLTQSVGHYLESPKWHSNSNRLLLSSPVTKGRSVESSFPLWRSWDKGEMVVASPLVSLYGMFSSWKYTKSPNSRNRLNYFISTCFWFQLTECECPSWALLKFWICFLICFSCGSDLGLWFPFGRCYVPFMRAKVK